MKIFGHPLHIMLIHFPSALFPMDLVCSVLALYYGDQSFAITSFYAMTGGVVLGVLAILTGIFDLTGVIKEKPAALMNTFIHGGINSCVVIAYGILVLSAFNTYPEVMPDSLPKLFFKGFLIAFMLAGNYIGGSLILKYKIGVEERGNEAV